jgi:hypothetical protein
MRLQVPLSEPRRRGRILLWRRQSERGSHLLHEKAILGCREQGVRHRPVRGSAHGRVEGGRPGRLHRKAILGCCKEVVRRRPVRGSAHGRVEGGWPGRLHRKAILGCCKEVVRRRPVRGSAHGRVKRQPGRGASDGRSVQGPGDAHDGPAGALALAARKRRPVGGWGRVVAPMAVHAGVPVAATAPTTRSWEAVATAT